jgi:hypothetical protein
VIDLASRADSLRVLIPVAGVAAVAYLLLRPSKASAAELQAVAKNAASLPSVLIDAPIVVPKLVQQAQGIISSVTAPIKPLIDAANAIADAGNQLLRSLGIGDTTKQTMSTIDKLSRSLKARDDARAEYVKYGGNVGALLASYNSTVTTKDDEGRLPHAQMLPLETHAWPGMNVFTWPHDLTFALQQNAREAALYRYALQNGL